MPVFDGGRWACPARGLKAPEWKDAGPVLIGLEDGDARGDQPSTLNAIGGFWCCTLCRPDPVLEVSTREPQRARRGKGRGEFRCKLGCWEMVCGFDCVESEALVTSRSNSPYTRMQQAGVWERAVSSVRLD